MPNKKRVEVATEGEDATKEITPKDKSCEDERMGDKGMSSCNQCAQSSSAGVENHTDQEEGKGNEGSSHMVEDGNVAKSTESTADSENQVPAPPKECMICSKPCTEAVSCEKCSCGCYCSVECKDKHDNHTKFCPIICSLEKLETEKRIAAEIFSVDSEKLPYKMKLKLIRLVGQRPVVNIFLEKKGVNGLWDTGAMVSVINDLFLGENFPDVEIRSIEEFVGKREFNVTVANQGALNIKGIAILKFGVSEDEELFEIPFLVTGDRLANTIIGYNTIEYLATNFREQLDLRSRSTLFHCSKREKCSSTACV